MHRADVSSRATSKCTFDGERLFGSLEEVGTDSTGGDAEALGWWTLDLMKPLREVHFKTKVSDSELGQGKERKALCLLFSFSF